MNAKIVLGGRFRVYEDGTINKVFDGVEAPAAVYYTGRNSKYGTVCYTQSGTQKHVYVHRLVATAFIPNPDGLPQVNHKDGNTHNNAASNLEWVTAAQNVRHAFETGLANPMATAVPCERCGNFTKSKDGVCGSCRANLAAEASEIDRRAEQMDRYSRLNFSRLSTMESTYARSAAEGYSVSEIAKKFSVSRQCVSAALLYAEKKSARGETMSAAQKNTRIALVNRLDRAKRKMAEAETKLQTAKIMVDASEQSLLLFEQTLCKALETNQDMSPTC